MSHPANDDEARIKVRELLGQIGTVMLVTTTEEGSLHARPMAIQAIEGDTVWFFNWHESPKAQQIREDSDVLISAANPATQDYVSAQGTARAMRDVEKQKALWTEGARVWFPKGAEDAGMGLISVHLTGAEYWDAPNSTMLHAYGYVKALATGTPPEGGENAKVSFQG
jgi:general stress protein 26